MKCEFNNKEILSGKITSILFENLILQLFINIYNKNINSSLQRAKNKHGTLKHIHAVDKRNILECYKTDT